MSLTSLANAAGLTPQDALAHAEALVALGNVDQINVPEKLFFRITGTGVVFVQNVPQGVESITP